MPQRADKATAAFGASVNLTREQRWGTHLLSSHGKIATVSYEQVIPNLRRIFKERRRILQ